jgi:hypothetical protein
MNCYFVIIGTLDNPIYEAEFLKHQDLRHLNQFILHSSLDIIDELVWGSDKNYLKVVDRFNQWNVSCFVTQSGQRLMLLHDQLLTDGIKHFFQEIYEILVKVMMNPFYSINEKITSSQFDQRVRGSARKWLS